MWVVELSSVANKVKQDKTGNTFELRGTTVYTFSSISSNLSRWPYPLTIFIHYVRLGSSLRVEVTVVPNIQYTLQVAILIFSDNLPVSIERKQTETFVARVGYACCT